MHVAPSLHLASTGRSLQRSRGLHTLYISPLKALAVDIARNLETPVAEMGLPIRVETRTGDTPASQAPAPAPRSARHPADHARAAGAAARRPPMRRICSATLQARRARRAARAGHLQARRSAVARPGAAVARWRRELRAIGLSATVAEPDELRASWCRSRDGAATRADLVVGAGGARRRSSPCSTPTSALPWAGHSARHALRRDLRRDQARTRTTLVFVNTRSQAEMLFQELWRINDDGLADRAASRLARRRASAARSRRRWRRASCARVVCTSTLDLGIDWGDVDLVINVGAPKGARRLLQRIGRANHRLDEPSQRAAGAGQPLRGAGMRGGARGGRRGRAGHARRCAPAGSTCWRSTCSAWPAPRRSTPTSSTPR